VQIRFLSLATVQVRKTLTTSGKTTKTANKIKISNSDKTEMT
jgi:hypothetical protein